MGVFIEICIKYPRGPTLKTGTDMVPVLYSYVFIQYRYSSACSMDTEYNTYTHEGTYQHFQLQI
jgi:hypothetical protein